MVCQAEQHKEQMDLGFGHSNGTSRYLCLLELSSQRGEFRLSEESLLEKSQWLSQQPYHPVAQDWLPSKAKQG
ncbi:unnamed protein product [Leuciscus chuanchicus]